MIQPGQEGPSEERRPHEQVDESGSCHVATSGSIGHDPADGTIEHPVDDAVDRPGERPRPARWFSSCAAAPRAHAGGLDLEGAAWRPISRR